MHVRRGICMQAGGIQPLVCLLRDDPDEISAELSAVVLRNLALQNAINRAAIKDAGGLQPLLRLLSMGQDKLVYPLSCEVQRPPLKCHTLSCRYRHIESGKRACNAIGLALIQSCGYRCVFKLSQHEMIHAGHSLHID